MCPMIDPEALLFFSVDQLGYSVGSTYHNCLLSDLQKVAKPKQYGITNAMSIEFGW